MQIAWSQCIVNGKICSENISPVWISYTVLLYVKYSASTDQEIGQETMQITDVNKISSNQQDSSLIKIALNTPWVFDVQRKDLSHLELLSERNKWWRRNDYAEE